MTEDVLITLGLALVMLGLYLWLLSFVCEEGCDCCLSMRELERDV